MNPIDVLIKYWGHAQFRLKQEEIIKQVLEKKDTLALLPTAGGKSICYQIPALIKEGICLVISPLISLMDDQVKHLQSKGIKSVAITSNMHYSEIDTTLTNCIYGGIKFLYLSPEKLQNELVRSRIKKMNINLITVDEAHCISEWGHNFRPAYRHISDIRTIIPNIPVLALTATATKDVINDIQKNLLFKNKNLIKSSFSRHNLSYNIDLEEDKRSKIIKLLNKIKSPTIIYAGTRKATKELTKFLINNNFPANYYHAGLSTELRTKIQESWTQNQTRIIVATNAFGMGINKTDVKLVIHMDLPPTIEAYFQEAGRAGRDGETAYAVLLSNKNDIKKQKNFLQLKYPSIEKIIKCHQNIANYLQIAAGDLPEDPIPFNIVKFSDKYETSVLEAYNMIKYLEKEEKIKLSNKIQSSSKIKIIIPKSELYRFQITNKFYDPFIKLLLRSYSNLFHHFVPINEQKIAHHSNKTSDDVKKILTKLQKLEILQYQEKNDLPQLTFLKPREDSNSLNINKKKWEERKNYARKKLEKIANYITTSKHCRSQTLLKYFDEKEANKCGICDVCTKEKLSTIEKKEFKDISRKIKNLLKNNELNLLEICNKIPNLSKKEIINILNLLFNIDKIKKFGNKYQWKE